MSVKLSIFEIFAKGKNSFFAYISKPLLDCF
jgi:hypothetical protein